MLEKSFKIFQSKSLRDIIERNVYGVCSYLGRKLSMPTMINNKRNPVWDI